jgi:hypothetical protein
LGTATGVVLVIGGVALYIRFVKGWRFSDLMYVTRSSLSSMTETMKSGEGGVGVRGVWVWRVRHASKGVLWPEILLYSKQLVVPAKSASMC